MSDYGTSAVSTTGRGLTASADGVPQYKVAGVSLDWDTALTASGDTTLSDGTVVPDGQRYLKPGTILCKIGGNATYTHSTTASGGDRDVTVEVDGGDPETAVDLAFDANAAAWQTALEGLANVGVGNVTVTGTTTKTITFIGDLAGIPVVVTIDEGDLTGGTDTLTETGEGTGSGLYGPYAVAGIDGRQTLTPGECFILNRSVTEESLKSDHPPVIDGGRVWKARVIASAVASNPASFATITAAFPNVVWVGD